MTILKWRVAEYLLSAIYGEKKGGGENLKEKKNRTLLIGTLSSLLGCALLTVLLSGGETDTQEVWAPILEQPSQSTVEVLTISHTAIPKQVIPIGRAVGIKLFSDGVLVVGMSPVDTGDGKSEPGKDAGLKTGDIITHMDGKEINTIEEVQGHLVDDADQISLGVKRGSHQLQLAVVPAENEKGDHQLGVWLRDSMAGIGTVTFYDPQSGQFGALGHGINDVDTAMLMPLDSGSIMPASVVDVKAGGRGDPGELHGKFEVTANLGDLYANTNMGIFGTLAVTDMATNGTPMDVATSDQIHAGTATILANIEGDKVEEFTVQITDVYHSGLSDTKNMMLQVTDPRLLQSTGGIVQGMSGSPILQDGRVVGAVTHVLVNDPTRGYGIFIENMLEASENTNK